MTGSIGGFAPKPQVGWRSGTSLAPGVYEFENARIVISNLLMKLVFQKYSERPVSTFSTIRLSIAFAQAATEPAYFHYLLHSSD